MGSLHSFAFSRMSYSWTLYIMQPFPNWLLSLLSNMPLSFSMSCSGLLHRFLFKVQMPVVRVIVVWFCLLQLNLNMAPTYLYTTFDIPLSFPSMSTPSRHLKINGFPMDWKKDWLVLDILYLIYKTNTYYSNL